MLGCWYRIGGARGLCRQVVRSVWEIVGLLEGGRAIGKQGEEE